MSEGNRLIRDRKGDFKYSVSGLDMLDDKSLSTAPKLSHRTGRQKKKVTTSDTGQNLEEKESKSPIE